MPKKPPKAKKRKPAPRKQARAARRPTVLRPKPIGESMTYCERCSAPLYKGVCVKCCPDCGDALLDGRCPLCDLRELRRKREAVGQMFSTPTNEAVALLLDIKIAEMSAATADDGN